MPLNFSESGFDFGIRALARGLLAEAKKAEELKN